MEVHILSPVGDNDLLPHFLFFLALCLHLYVLPLVLPVLTTKSSQLPANKTRTLFPPELPSFPPRPGLDPARGPPTQFSDLPRLPGLSALSSWVPKSLRTRLPWSLQARGPTNPESVLAHPHPLTSDCAFPPPEQCFTLPYIPAPTLVVGWGKGSPTLCISLPLVIVSSGGVDAATTL